jgi:hypothetical protein
MPNHDPDAQPSTPRDGLCNDSDGFSVCTESPGHRPPHYDISTQHEWDDDPYAGEEKSGNLWNSVF